MAQAYLAGLTRASSPIPCTGVAVELLASTALTTDPNGAVSGIVNVEQFRFVTFWIKASVDAANAYAHIVPLVSASEAAPAQGDDSWYGVSISDIAPTDTLLTGTLPTGADYSIAPEWGVVKSRPIVIRTIDGDANTDEIRMTVTINVTHARWMYIACEEVTGNMTLAVDWNGHL